jgi:hypothetical protein
MNATMEKKTMIINRINQLTLITGITLGLMLQTIPAEARQTITCESFKYRYQFCRVNTRGGVRLTRQISNTRCNEGETWGYDREGIWVDQGCAAEFSVRGGGGNQNNNNNNNISSGGGDNTAAIVGGALVIGAIAAAIAGGSDGNSNNNSSSDGRQTITCNSKDDQYTTCPINLSRGNRVVLDRQLSQAGCWEGDTWGYNRDEIWVDNGCRGLFEIRP